MKVLLFVLGCLTGIACDNRPCTLSFPCRPTECCVMNYLGTGGICKEPGDDIGDMCGGEYFCEHCDDYLVCVPEPENPNVKRLARGTCQMPQMTQPMGQYRTTQPPTMQHPTMQPPTMQHPTMQHPTMQHPTMQNPTMQPPRMQTNYEATTMPDMGMTEDVTDQNLMEETMDPSEECPADLVL